ncbi:translational GTPase TypA [Paenibacillus larvae]|uniref:Large ribosomal subunit assembly factor BipA n=2 Tax=Paenibacillus larvae subsp. larvae TaxID=147375 RepID=V9W5K9_9BACL|nr:translational GTPase TypA [Paenibacillus larvae]AHD06286.1 GTP-binding protein TypA/BipA-like protein [Paenibacillus larvae subsp. larvae DSM 25430]AQR77348.1 GTP-binding protein TypA [Paenibacillus larvae subsp. larvae]AVF21647.1 GTP-binding protein TypA/BipA-like protein [Paenibacillus larvae subsp. larvae]AVG12824.1 GTP-binding protein TypA/BipA-like protein [Paenibacillus larvae subsp. larvae DSM 25430]ETK27660.1 GTP-binding protein TypA/BipA-like [Paenibacillus larvae subsp. larvae DSM
MHARDKIKNIAIIAHVDHGKTTLVDKLLQQSGTFRENETVQERAMDSNDLERERGITILAKNTAVHYKDYLVNIVDTPGHADFGGEVERIMKMVDGVLLVVDAFEGTMPQTKFVLRKALEQNLTPIVVVNKIDRPNARPLEVIDEVLELFIELEASDEQLDFPVVYASALQGTASLDPNKQDEHMSALYETIVNHIPSPKEPVDQPLQFLVTLMDYNEYLGRIGIGRVNRGVIRQGQSVAVMTREGGIKQARIEKLFGFQGLKRVEIKEAGAGDIVAISGIKDINIGETIADPEKSEALPVLKIDEPTLQMTFLVNNSPFAGREGKWVTSRKLRERLMKELETDVSLRVEDTDSPDAFIVSGRGELHLGILIENMRREGFELQVSKPEVIIKEVDGKKMEPIERLIIDVPEDSMGAVMESLGTRKAEMVNMINNGSGNVRLEFLIPARGLIGYRTSFLTLTRGYGVLNHAFDSYGPFAGSGVGGRHDGVLVSMENGVATTYGILSIEDRGTLFVTPGTEVYEGMIVGEHNRDNDIVVNICKEKQLTNVRSATKEETVKMKTPRLYSLEQALEYLNDDEYCEITPSSIRLRKKILNKNERERAEKHRKNAEKSV